jgi:hypothetical protein
MIGLDFVIVPIDEVGKVINVREDINGEKIIDLELSCGEFYVARMFELMSTVML